MDVKLTPKQIKAYKLLTDNNAEVSEVLYGGGARGGKTWLGCFWQIARRLTYAGSAGMIVRRSYVDLHGTTLRTFRAVADFLGVSPLISYHYGTENTIEFANGSVIFLRYAEFKPKDPEFNRFGSYDLTDLFADEAQEIDRGFFNIIRGRFSKLTGVNPDGKPWRVAPKQMLACNPSKGWIYADWWKPYRDGYLKPYQAFIRALVDDNPHVDKAYIDNLMRSDKVTIQRLRYGNFDYDDDDCALFDDYDALCDMFTNAVEFRPDIQTLAAGAADIALKGHDRFALVWSKDGVYTFSRVIGWSDAPNLQDVIQAELTQHHIPRSRFCVDADGVGEYLPDYIKGIKAFHGGAAAFDSTLYTNLKTQCYYELARLVKKRVIRVDGLTQRQQEELKEELQAIRIEGKDNDVTKCAINTKESQKKILGRSPDLADALMMCVCANMQPNVRPATISLGHYDTDED